MSSRLTAPVLSVLPHHRRVSPLPLCFPLTFPLPIFLSCSMTSHALAPLASHRPIPPFPQPLERLSAPEPHQGAARRAGGLDRTACPSRPRALPLFETRCAQSVLRDP
eukprot:2762135-Rhodomonas_salina.2